MTIEKRAWEEKKKVKENATDRKRQGCTANEVKRNTSLFHSFNFNEEQQSNNKKPNNKRIVCHTKCNALHRNPMKCKKNLGWMHFKLKLNWKKRMQCIACASLTLSHCFIRKSPHTVLVPRMQWRLSNDCRCQKQISDDLNSFGRLQYFGFYQKCAEKLKKSKTIHYNEIERKRREREKERKCEEE